MSRVLVTGASGFVGGHLVEALVRRDYGVRCLVRQSSKLKHLPVDDLELVNGDLLDFDAVDRAIAGCDVVYHCAGAIAVLKSQDFAIVNVDGTSNIVRACLRQPRPPVLVLVSSVSAAGPAQLDRPRTEDDPPRPMSFYGRSKRGGEEVAEAAAGRLPLTIVRPGIVFGPRDRELFAAIDCIWRTYAHILPRRVTPPLSFIEVRDLANLLITAGERGRRVPPPGLKEPGTGDGYYFATNGEFPTYREFGNIAARALGRRRAIIIAPPRPIPWTMALASEAISRFRQRPVTFCRDKFYEAIVESWACSNQRACEQLAFAPTGTFDDQMRRAIEWYRAEGWI
jgi:dihydroflavonol-4-reductase